MNGSNLIEKIQRHWYRHARLQRPLFLHIPKTGGTYLNQIETNWQDRKPVVEPLDSLGHATLIDTTQPLPPNYPPMGMGDPYSKPIDELKRCFIVTTVRNPFDWLVSYAAHAGGWSARYCDKDHYDYALSNKGFGELLRAICDREDPWPSRKFLFMQAFSSSGALSVDWFCRTEQLDKGLEELAHAKRLIYRRQPKQRVGERKDYRAYYDDKLISLVYETWGRELSLYGYDFDGPRDNAHLLGPVPKRIKKAVRYTWADDKLTIDHALDWSISNNTKNTTAPPAHRGFDAAAAA